MGNCIGKRNRKKFVLFVISINFLVIILIIYNSCNLKYVIYQYEFDKSVEKRLVWLTIFLTLELFIEIFLFVLLIFHFYLIFSALNTYEFFKNMYSFTRNPFNNGCCLNFNQFISSQTGKQNVDLNFLIKKEEIDESNSGNSQNSSRKVSDNEMPTLTIVENN